MVIQVRLTTVYVFGSTEEHTRVGTETRGTGGTLEGILGRTRPWHEKQRPILFIKGDGSFAALRCPLRRWCRDTVGGVVGLSTVGSVCLLW
jgi:hypothetical protein